MNYAYEDLRNLIIYSQAILSQRRQPWMQTYLDFIMIAKSLMHNIFDIYFDFNIDYNNEQYLNLVIDYIALRYL